jgi:hypothetical protein
MIDVDRVGIGLTFDLGDKRTDLLLGETGCLRGIDRE